ncbi:MULTISPECIES: SDR family NAD(P)-dependent oxidoreductase [Klebsiella]|uniref:SDR family NAD(P)-dependent oxidoreductase n=1 Tax=Klebsiella TaxID=570 RepID=UPI0007420E8D|nr:MULTISPECIES: SDR family oxidoreductase [Klebsiella]HCF8807165.1 SDR family oxidoreductase [Klebsiella pneumoniae]HCQ8039599.1 SDR family oxidoreductase [Klebsiella quasipneumoniae subsp. quasipneumoniae]ELS4497389.1 SDR family oxidoreductase [Klebsiella michiganensis]ELS4630350.1 SDR family oxidoreductase [Klebsiella michiganensis]KSY16999.1 3-oxoacyl-ACP reductase [Klebsiella quasipneumoniae]
MEHVLITGGSRGIGASTAIECARRGFGVILTLNSKPEAASQVVERIQADGRHALALQLNVEDASSFPQFRSVLEGAMESHWGTRELHGLVNNAGYGLYNPIETVTEAQSDSLMNVHLKGPFFLTQTLLPLLQPNAAIVNLTSATTRVATAGVAPYVTFKGGLEDMAKEFGERKIRINAVSPGPIRTELVGGLSDEFEALLAGQTVLGRIGEPDEVARVIAGLLSADYGWINAQTIEVAGGYNI